jgi:nucleotide-binding universal stress UspA family protein
MNTTSRPAVIVGVSGSKASSRALLWAAQEARRRHARLRVVRTWDPEFDAVYASAGERLTPDQQREAASGSLAAAVLTAFGSQTPDGMVTELAEGIAERALADLSVGADLLVLGSAALTTPTGRSIGPVVRGCLSRAHCPVVVVCPEEQEASRPEPAGLHAVLRARVSRLDPSPVKEPGGCADR